MDLCSPFVPIEVVQAELLQVELGELLLQPRRRGRWFIRLRIAQVDQSLMIQIGEFDPSKPAAVVDKQMRGRFGSDCDIGIELPPGMENRHRPAVSRREQTGRE